MSRLGRKPLDMNRPCTKCNRTPAQAEFYRYKAGWRYNVCKDCHNQKNREKYASNSVVILSQHKEWKRLNRGLVKEQGKVYRAANKEKIQEATKKRYQSLSPDQLQKLYEARSKWGKNNPLKERHKAHLRRVKLRSLIPEGTWTPREWEQIKMFYNYRCLSCHKKEPEIILTLDHVIPLSKGGSNSKENLQPLCRSCNSRKSDKDTDYRLTKPMWTFPEEERGYDFEEEEDEAYG